MNYFLTIHAYMTPGTFVYICKLLMFELIRQKTFTTMTNNKLKRLNHERPVARNEMKYDNINEIALVMTRTIYSKLLTIDTFSSYIRPWWRHQMETVSALLTLYVRRIHRPPVNDTKNCTVTAWDEFPKQFANWEICYGQKRFEFKMGFRRITHATKASIEIFFNELEIRKIGCSYSLDSVASFIARLMIGSVHQHGTPVPLTQLNRFSRWRIQLNIYQIAILVQSLKLQWTSSL